MGLILEGERTLGFFERQISPDWVIELFKLAEGIEGLSHVHFYNVYSDQKLKGKTREHPLTDLFKESFVAEVGPKGEIIVDVAVDAGKRVAGLWISSDGDDTGAKFEVTITEIILSQN